jgi:hypothetical protein
MSAEPILDEAALAVAAIDRLKPLISRDQWHRYTTVIDGKKQVLPGVTSVIGVLDKTGVNRWSVRVQQEADIAVAWRMNQDYHAYDEFEFVSAFERMAGKEKENAKLLKKAGEIGTDVHALVETWCQRAMGKVVDDPIIKHDKAYFVYAGFEEWAKSVDLKPVAVEAFVCSLEYRFGGTMDLLGYMNGHLTLLDWKTGGVYPEHILQNVAYRKALQEMSGVMAEGLLVNLPKKGNETAITVHPVTEDVDEQFNIFKSLIPVYNWIKANEKAKRSKK